jgi:hypothetical protein
LPIGRRNKRDQKEIREKQMKRHKSTKADMTNRLAVEFVTGITIIK